MNRMKVALSLLTLAFIAAIALLIHFFGFYGLVRIALGAVFIVASILFLVFTGILIYARSIYSLLSLIALLLSIYAFREVYLSRILSAVSVLLIF
ncbi:MAG: hypothetical protein H5T46_05685, partial [Archaeoglobi archaeon]|nr:hypothetical protein [Candidatus Mnemosynella sp.]